MRIVLLSDVGGTFVRFALYYNNKMSAIVKLKGDDYPSYEAAVKAYLKTKKLKPTDMIVGVAGPVDKGRAKLTNRSWSFDERKLKKTFDLYSCSLVNDFVLKGYGALFIRKNELVQIGTQKPEKDMPMCVIGPGTGLGICFLTKGTMGWEAHPSEGGHTDIAPANERQAQIINHISGGKNLSAEEVISGRGLTAIYKALNALQGKQVPNDVTNVTVLELAETGDKIALETCELFFDFLGTFAGNMAIAMKTTGGVYLTSSLLRFGTMMERFTRHAFRDSFERRGKMAQLASTIPTFVITRSQSAFLGLKKLAQALINSSN